MGRWYESPAFLLGAPSKDVTAPKLCSSRTHWVWPAPSAVYGRTTRVSQPQFPSFGSPQYSSGEVSSSVPHQQYPPPRRQFTTCHDQDGGSSIWRQRPVAFQNTYYRGFLVRLSTTEF